MADGHLTDIPVASVYFWVVSLYGIRLFVFLADLNKMETWCTDIGNAYLKVKTNDKVYIIAGTEFGGRQSHIIIFSKELFILWSSGL